MASTLRPGESETAELSVSYDAHGAAVYDGAAFARCRDLKVGDRVEVRVSPKEINGHTLQYVIKYEIKVGETGTLCKSPQYQPHERPYPTSYPARLGTDFAPQLAINDGLAPEPEPFVVYVVEKERQLEVGPLQIPGGSALLLERQTDGFKPEHEQEVRSMVNRFLQAGHRNPEEVRAKRALEPSTELAKLQVTIRRVRPS